MLFHGKEYTEVKDRIKIFRTAHPEWSVVTAPHWHSADMGAILFHAVVQSNEGQQFHGWAYEERTENTKDVNFSSWVENCETSAIGRALANMDIAGGTERPSAEEMGKVERAVAKVNVEPGITLPKKLTLLSSSKSTKMDFEREKLKKTRETMKQLLGHDQPYQQMLDNRKIATLESVESVETIRELTESMVSMLEQCVRFIRDVVPANPMATFRDVPDTDRDSVSEKIKKLSLLV